MLFDLFAKVLPGETIMNTCDRMTWKYGTDTYVDMIHKGFDKPFSKYRREFFKALSKEIVDKVTHTFR